VGGQTKSEAGGSDAELVARLRQRDAGAFRLLAGRHAQAVYRAVWRYTGGHADCEDFVQEAFLRLWNAPDALRDGAAVRSWLMRTASNLAIDRLRKTPPVPLDRIAEPEADPPGEAARSAVAGAVDRALAELPERQRLALVLVYYEQMSNIEAAAALETSVEAVESLLARARRTLRSRLAAERDGLLDDLRELNG
jgi:RNA polymerase sigma-70 factor (ECF subfamily)